MPKALTECPSCGEPIGKTDSRFCMNCGASLVRAAPAVQAPETPVVRPARAADVPATRLPAPAPIPSATSQVPATVTTTAPERRRALALLNVRSLFGLVDIVALLVAIAVFGYTRLQPASAACQPLEAPSAHILADSRRAQGGTLDGFVVFQGGQTYLIPENQALTVPEGGTLLIEPGARLQFGQGSALDVHGRLHACGNSGKPIVFTSDRDEVEQRSGPAPAAGDWVGIRFFDEADDQSVLGHVQIRYAGRDNHGAIHLGNASPTLTAISITDSKWAPISTDPNAMPKLAGTVELTNVPLRGIEVRGGRISQDVTWDKLDLVYAVSGDLLVSEATRLTIKPGVVVKFAPDRALDVEGTLLASGNSRAAPALGDEGAIVFTSLKDDSIAGDTDVRAAAPEAGDWRGILLRGSSNRSTLHGAIIRYAGRDGRAALHLEGAAPELTANRIEESKWYAISADANARPTITGNVLDNIAQGSGLEIRGGSLEGRETWQWQASDSDMLRVVTGNLAVGREGSFEIGPGLIVRFARDTGIQVNGALRVSGEKDKPVIFTSIRDDAGDAGGDVDGSAAAPAAGDWDGILFSRDSNERLSAVRFATIRYANVGLQLVNVSPTLDNVVISDTSGHGITCEEDAKPVLTAVSFSRNGQGDHNCP